MKMIHSLLYTIFGKISHESLKDVYYRCEVIAAFRRSVLLAHCYRLSKLEIVFTIAAPRFWYHVYWMCIEYKDCLYNC